MKKHEIHTFTQTSGFSSMKEELTKRVGIFLDRKASEGYTVVNISYTYFQARELICFVTICK